MADKSLQERVVATVRQALGPNVDLQGGNLQLSSLKMLELIVALEAEFGVHISEDDPMAQITSSIKSIVTHLEKLGIQS